MSGELRILEPWHVLLNAEFISLDVTTGNLRVRVAGSERTYIGTNFRFNEVRLPLHNINAIGMPGGVISIAKALPDWPAEPSSEPSTDGSEEAATDMHTEGAANEEIVMAKGSRPAPHNGPSKTGEKSGPGRGNNPPRSK